MSRVDSCMAARHIRHAAEISGESQTDPRAEIAALWQAVEALREEIRGPRIPTMPDGWVCDTCED